jgi:RimJ/RimL family protein N-acetyltransferase
MRPEPAAEGWSAGEWRDLLAGDQPWAMLLRDGAAVSVCHSSRWAPRAAEAGLWTHPAHRRRGYGVAVTRAWADLVAATGRIAFYSTSSGNVASQAVAARLGARQIGTMWSVRPALGR